MQAKSADAAGVEAVRAALGPFAWQSFTAASVSRRAVAAMGAAGVLPSHPAPRHPSDPVQVPEECVEALVEVLNSCLWRSFTIDGLSRLLVGTALAWQHEQAWFDIRLGLLLDGVG